MPDGLRTIGRADFDRAAAADPYWSDVRWEYVAVACDWARGLPGVRRVLEIGPYTLPLVFGGDTMDVRQWGATPPTFLHDAGSVPWPVPDGAYDLAIALQVWEHLAGRQRAAFAELRRVARRAILSLPFEWPGDSDHSGIGMETIARWAGGLAPQRFQVTGRHRRRIVLLWEFDR